MRFHHRHHAAQPPLVNLLIHRLNNTHFLAQPADSSISAPAADPRDDQDGAVLYVVVVVFLWGLSIVLLIASYVRKNRMDNNISLYLKQIQTVQRRTRKEKVLRLISLLPTSASGSGGGCGGGSTSQFSSSQLVCRSETASPSPAASPTLSTHHRLSLLTPRRSLSPLPPPPLPLAAALAAAAPSRVKRHSFGCFLPEICVHTELAARNDPL